MVTITEEDANSEDIQSISEYVEQQKPVKRKQDDDMGPKKKSKLSFKF